MNAPAVLSLVTALGPATPVEPAVDAPAACMASEEAARFVRERERVATWQVAFGTGLGVVAAAMAAQAVFRSADDISDDYRLALWVTTAKAGIGALTPVFSPLRIPEPGATCAELDAARATAAHNERRAFRLTILGGIALNLIGFAVLAAAGAWELGLLGTGLGGVVTFARAATQPTDFADAAPAPSLRLVPSSAPSDAHPPAVLIGWRWSY